jgi:hypothetical protein
MNIEISPYSALPSFNIGTWGSNCVQWDPAQPVSLFHRSSLPSSLLNVLPPLQPTFNRRTNGHCQGTCIVVNLAVSSLNVVSRPNLPPHFLFSVALSLCLRLQRVSVLLWWCNVDERQSVGDGNWVYFYCSDTSLISAEYIEPVWRLHPSGYSAL